MEKNKRRSMRAGGPKPSGVKKHSVKISGIDVEISNPEKIFYPSAGFKKIDLIQYYIEIGPLILPHLKDRPLTMKRYPNGVDQPFFFEKHCPEYRPKFVETAPVWSKSAGKDLCFCLVNNLPSLVWVANLASIELHPLLCRYQKPDCPTALAFDLDPGPPATIVECCRVALLLRDLFVSLHCKAFAKTSGSKGLQVYVPLNTPVTFEKTKTFAHAVAAHLSEKYSDLVLDIMEKKKRKNRVFVDWSQNDRHKTTVAVYSMRAREMPTVSTPVEWDEVEHCVKKKKRELLVFQSVDVLKRVQKMGDRFLPVLQLKQKLPRL